MSPMEYAIFSSAYLKLPFSLQVYMRGNIKIFVNLNDRALTLDTLATQCQQIQVSNS